MFKKTLCLVLLATVFAGYTNAAVINVDIQNLAFNPQAVVINVGDSVKWTNLDTFTDHTSTSTSGLWDSGLLSAGDMFEFEFLVPPGSYEYKCAVHPSMLGKVVVQGCFLEHTPDFIIAQTGGTVDFKLHAGAVNGGRNYILLGTVSGTAPGFPLPGGFAVLPINWDPFTDLVLAFINTPVFMDFLGQLDANGQAFAQLNAPPLPANAVGLEMDFAYALNNPWDCASNPVKIRIN